MIFDGRLIAVEWYFFYISLCFMKETFTIDFEEFYEFFLSEGIDDEF